MIDVANVAKGLINRFIYMYLATRALYEYFLLPQEEQIMLNTVRSRDEMTRTNTITYF